VLSVNDTSSDQTVQITVSYSDGSKDYSDSKTVTVEPDENPLTPNFTFTTSGLTASFTDRSAPDSQISSRNWDFGDGETGSGSSTSHDYSSGGQYNVTLTVESEGGNSKTISKTIFVQDSPEPPIASFSATPGSPTTGESVDFTSQSNDPDGRIISSEWSFTPANGSNFTDSRQNPTESFSNEGAVEVTLTVTDDQGKSDSMTKTIVVRGSNTPSAPNPDRFVVLPADQSAVLSWRKPELSGMTIDQFDVRYRQTGATSWKTTSFSSGTRRDEITDLNNGTTYEVQIATDTSSNGTSDWMPETPKTVSPYMIKAGGQTFSDLQNAINNSASNDLGTVKLGAETFSVSSTIQLDDGVSLTGAGPGFTELDGSVVSPVLHVDAASGDPVYAISDLTITGSSTSPGIDVSGPADVRIHHVILRDLNGDAVNLGGSSQGSLFNLTLVNNTGNGIDLGTSNVTLSNNLYIGNGGYAVRNSSGNTVSAEYFNAAQNNGTSGPQFNKDQQFNNVVASGAYMAKPITFRDPQSNDYRVAEGAATIDQGDPSDDWMKEPGSNGARINIGAYGNTVWAAESSNQKKGPEAGNRSLQGTTTLAGANTTRKIELTAQASQNSITLSWRVPFLTQNLSRDKSNFSAELKYRGINVDTWNTVEVSSDAFTLPQDSSNTSIFYMDGEKTVENLSPGRTFEFVLYIYYQDGAQKQIVDPLSLTSSTSGGSSSGGSSGSSGGGGGGGGTAGPALLLLVMSTLGIRLMNDS
jgi:PKD repeat protein